MPAPKTVIKLSVTKTLQDGVNPESGGNLLRIQVTEGVNIDPQIFIFQRDVDSEFSPEDLSLFWAVASVSEMSTLPAGMGNSDEPFFRLDVLESVFQTPQKLEEFLSKIIKEIRQLQRANDIILDPNNAETVCVEVAGGVSTIVPCPEESSSSSSSSL